MSGTGGQQARGGVEITLRHVTKRYPGERTPAVDDVSLTIPAGETTVFVGPSGCGKTTTLRMINRLIEPSAGTITVGGEDTQRLDPVRLRRSIGYAIQQAGLFPQLTVAQNVGMVPELLGWDRERRADRVTELLRLVGLDPAEFRGRYPRRLSGGQQQRVGVARALAADPPVLLMDEPFGAVDPITRAGLQDELLHLQATLGKTIVFVTHDFDEAVKLGNRIAVLGASSRVLQYDTPAAILAGPADATVAGFTGAGAALRRLGLLRVGDIAVGDAVLGTVDGSAAAFRRELAARGERAGLVLDADRRPVRWVDVDELSGADSLADVGRPVGDPVPTRSTLRAGLVAILAARGPVPVTGDRGEYVGVLRIETVLDAVRPVAETVR